MALPPTKKKIEMKVEKFNGRILRNILPSMDIAYDHKRKLAKYYKTTNRI